MKKFLLILCLLMSVICVFGFSACGGVKFKINFVVDGEIYATVNTKGGETIKMPDNPAKDGYTFDGWFWDKDVWETPFSANSLLDAPLSSDMNVYAKWKEDERPNKNALLLSTNGFTIDGNNGKISVSNDTETFSFINQVQVSAGASWSISTDIYGMQTIATKTIPLNIGNNTVYLLITSCDGENMNLYTMTVRRRPIYTVSFNTNGGTTVDNQQVEEDSFAEMPTTTKTGYTFTGWDYDFAKPIINDTEIVASWTFFTLTTETNNGKAGTISNYNLTKITVGEELTIIATTNAGYTFNGWYSGEKLLTNASSYTFKMASENVIYTASWTANTDTPYKVEYYLENLDDNKFSLDYTENLTGTTDTTAIKTVDRTYEHYTITNDTVSGNINGDGSMVLRVYYYLEQFAINITSTNNISLNIPDTMFSYIDYCNGIKYVFSIKYGSKLNNISATFNNYLGYEWKGWYSNDDLITENFSLPEFTVDKNMSFVAKDNLKEEMSIFNFTTNEEVCTITGVNDKSLTEIVIPDYITNINLGAFRGCSQLESITLPFVGNRAGITANDTHQYPFGYIFGTIQFADSTKTEQNYYDYLTNTTRAYFYIPSSLQSVSIVGGDILRGAFENCSMLKNLTIGDNVANIDSSAFSSCSIENIKIPTKVISSIREIIGSRLKTVEITSGEDIKNEAFAGCSTLTNVIIADSVINIGELAFYFCPQLTSVIFNNANGWKVATDSEMSDAITLSDNTLINEETAAYYLRRTYVNYYWQRG